MQRKWWPLLGNKWCQSEEMSDVSQKKWLMSVRRNEWCQSVSPTTWPTWWSKHSFWAVTQSGSLYLIVDILLCKRPVNCRRFDTDFAGSRFCFGGWWGWMMSNESTVNICITMMKSYRLKLESQSKIDWRKKGGGIESCYGRLTCHEHLENSSRLGLLNDHDPGSHIGVVQSDRLVSKSVTNAWLQFVYVSKLTFSSDILLQHFSFPFEIFILHSTNR